MLWLDRKQQNSVKQLSFNKKINKKKLMFNKWQCLIQRARSIVMRKKKERAGQQEWLNIAFELHICPPAPPAARKQPQLRVWARGDQHPNPASRTSSLVIMADWLITDYPLAENTGKHGQDTFFFFFQSASSHQNITRALQTKGPRSQKECMS